MRTISLVVCSTLVLLATGCGGGNVNAPARLSQEAQRQRLIQVLRKVPPPGTRVYVLQGVTVIDGNKRMAFDDEAVQARTPSGLTVTSNGQVYHFSADAVIDKSSTTEKLFLPPGARVPAFLNNRAPSYITH